MKTIAELVVDMVNANERIGSRELTELLAHDSERDINPITVARLIATGYLDQIGPGRTVEHHVGGVNGSRIHNIRIVEVLKAGDRIG